MSATLEYTAPLVQAVAESANDFAAWQKQLEAVAVEDNQRQWAIGELLVEGEDRFGRKKAYKEAAKLFGKKLPTVKDYAYVARNVPASVRTDALPFTHHKRVARFHNPEYQQELLAFAVKNNLNDDHFREYINSKHPPVKKSTKPAGAIHINLPPETLASVQLFAKANQESVGKAVIYLLEHALQTAEIKREIALEAVRQQSQSRTGKEAA